MATLKDLLATSNELTQQLVESGGEITPEIDAQLMVMTDHLPDKVDSYEFVMRRLGHEEEYWSARAEEAARIAKSCKAAAERLKERVKYLMLEHGVNELKGNDSKIVLQNSTPKLVIDESKLPAKYWITETVSKPNKPLIRQQMASEEIPGVVLEPTTALRTYANRGDK